MLQLWRIRQFLFLYILLLQIALAICYLIRLFNKMLIVRRLEVLSTILKRLVNACMVWSPLLQIWTIQNVRHRLLLEGLIVRRLIGEIVEVVVLILIELVRCREVLWVLRQEEPWLLLKVRSLSFILNSPPSLQILLKTFVRLRGSWFTNNMLIFFRLKMILFLKESTSSNMVVGWLLRVISGHLSHLWHLIAIVYFR